jgi:dCMP deaminase
MEIANVVAKRGTCNRADVGAVIAREGRIISTGYVGAPAGQPHCTDVGCEIGNHKGCTRTIHAEVNAIVFAARFGIATDGGTIYSLLCPCYDCAKAIVNAGIVRLVYHLEYRDSRGLRMLEATPGFQVEHI